MTNAAHSASATSLLGFDLLEPVQAPWIRPGAVVHDSAERVDGLIADFAVELKARGFTVIGVVDQPTGDSPRGLDLASGGPVAMSAGVAEEYLRHAMRENADLLVISHFPAAVQAMAGAKAQIGLDATQGMPLLTSVAGRSIHEWHAFAHHEGTMLAPDRRSLWAWWGPERLYRDLALGIGDAEVRHIACGSRWLMVESALGAGLSYLPKAPRELLPRLNKLTGRSLRELAGLTFSWDPLETALGVAAINAWYNRFDLEGQPGNGVRAFHDAPGRAVVVGAFPGIEDVLPNCAVIEASPRPGEYPTVAMDSLLPGAGAAVINASALVNRTLPRILKLARSRRLALIGPATPLTSRLFDYGVEILSGLVVDDAHGLGLAIEAGALPRDFARFGRFVHIARSLVPADQPPPKASMSLTEATKRF